MSKAAVEAEFHRNPKVTNTPSGEYLSLAARGALMTILSWCADKLSDGRLSRAAIRVQPTLKPLADLPEAVQELADAGFLEAADDFNGWYVHDYLDHNLSAAEVKAAREGNARRQAKLRSKRKSESDNHALRQPLGTIELDRATLAAVQAAENDAYEDTGIVDIASRRERAVIGYEWWSKLTGTTPSTCVWRAEFAEIGGKPQHERDLVAKHWRQTKYIEERPSGYSPQHVCGFWADFVVGPRGSAKPPVSVRNQRRSSTASSEAELSNVPIPDWAEAK